MACFIVPTGEAIVVALAKKVAEEKAKKTIVTEEHNEVELEHISFTRKLGWLVKMLIGGAVLLAFEHLWHGEVVPYFPFLTAMYDPSDTAEMLHEMATVGTTMACIITAVWVGMVIVTSVMEKKAFKEKEAHS